MRGIAGEHALDDARERPVHRRVQLGGRAGRAVHDAIEDDFVRFAREWMLGCEHLVEHHPQRKDVAALVDRAAVVGLGRHVLRRARRAGVELRGRRRLRRPRAAAGHPPRDAEVEDLDFAPAGEHEVLGLDVAMDEALLVRSRQRLDALPREVPERFDRHGLAQAAAQRFAFDVLHDDEQLVTQVEHVVDGGDAAVVHPARAPRLLEHSCAPLRCVLSPLVAHALERHRTLEERVEREEDLAHAAAAEHPLDAESARQEATRGTGRPGRIGTGIPRSAHGTPRMRWSCGTPSLRMWTRSILQPYSRMRPTKGRPAPDG